MIPYNKLKDVIENNTSRSGKRFDYFIQILIILSLISFSIETLPNLSKTLVSFFYYFETITVIIFLIEYLLRFYVASNKLKYIFSFYGIIDLLAILPYILGSFIDLRFIRIFRIFRILRAFKLIRYNYALQRFSIAFKLIREELILFLGVTLILIYITSAGIYFFENESQPDAFKSIFHSAWWAVATLTTVGYGDIYPITIGGKVFTFLILIFGLGIVTVPAGLFASSLSKAREILEKRDSNYKKDI
tara:strand:+ start:69 stop:809 length:741 start_codon:yes stop_codon:yes gene_type:complete